MLDEIRRVFDYRELIFCLATKEIKIKYKSAVLGWLWSILNPLLLVVIFTAVFTFIIKMNIDKFPAFLLCALLPWFFLSFSLSSATTSIVENSGLIKKVNFPYEVIPISVVLANLFNFVVSMFLLIIGLSAFHLYPTLNFVLLPFVIVFEFMFVLGICFISCALHAMFRDVKYFIELLLIVWFYATPIFYPLSFVPEKVRFLFYLNPLTLFINTYRDILLYQKPIDLPSILNIILISLIFLSFGFLIFSRYKKIFADIT